MKASDIRRGHVIMVDGQPCRVMDFQHRTPGNLRAFVQVRFRNLNSGNTFDTRLSATEFVEDARLDTKELQVLYRDANGVHVMDADSYEQYTLDDDVAQPADYLDARYDNDRRSFPADREYWDSVMALTRWDGSRFVELQLHPITLGYQTSRPERGRPKLASAADAVRILDMMVTRSKPFGVTVTVRDGVGIVTPTPEGLKSAQ